MARSAHSQVGVYEAWVIALESEIAYWDATNAELRWTINELEQGHLDFKFDLSQDKAKVLQRLSEYRVSSSKREEALQAEVVAVRRAMREAADSFAATKKNFAQLSAMPAFPGDPATLVRRCIGTTMAYLEVAHEE